MIYEEEIVNEFHTFNEKFSTMPIFIEFNNGHSSLNGNNKLFRWKCFHIIRQTLKKENFHIRRIFRLPILGIIITNIQKFFILIFIQCHRNMINSKDLNTLSFLSSSSQPKQFLRIHEDMAKLVDRFVEENE